MAEVFYPPIPATDSTLAPVPGAVFEVFELTDTAYATPLSLRVGDGNPSTTVTAGTLGTVPGTYVTSDNYSHNWKSGTFVWRRDSFDAAQKATEDSAIAARDAANLVGAPAGDAIQVAVSPGGAAYGTLDSGYARKNAPAFHRQVRELEFNQKTFPANGSYIFPGMVDTIDGEFVMVYRDGSKHDLATGSTPGPLYRRISSDDGQTWGSPLLIADHSATNTGDVRDPFMYRVPGERRIWVTYFVDEPSTALNGSWITYSDDDGRTFSTPVQITTGTAVTPGGLRKSIDGVWRMPIYSMVGGFWRAELITASDPLGPWSAPVTVYAPAAANATEWDFVEVSPTNWIAGIRVSGSNVMISQSTNAGVTWSAPVVLPTISSRIYEGWPALRLTRDGRVWLFSRAQNGGGGQRVVQLLETSAPLTATNWAEPGTIAGTAGYLDTSGGGFTGKYQPFLVGDTWVSVYMAELVAGDEAEARIGRIRDDALGVGYSFNSAFSGIPDGSAAAWQNLPVVDRVKVRSKGGYWRIKWQMRSYQPSGTVSNYQIDVAVDGVRRSAASGTADTWATIAGATRTVTGSGYDDFREGIVWLTPGLHTIEILYYQQTTTIGRLFGDRMLMVAPL